MGRTRSFPHVRGNWVSYLYIPCETAMTKTLNDLILEAQKDARDLSIHLIDDQHLSLSRTQPFRHHWIEPFVKAFTETMKIVPRMDLFLDKFEVYVNDEKTRTFIGINIVPSESLLGIVENCDKCLMDFQLEPYYEDPSFHISCAWMLGNQKNLLENKLLPILNRKWSSVTDADALVLPVDRIELKTGNTRYQFSLHHG